MKRIYLDWNASEPLSKQASSAMIQSLKQYGNPSSIHFEGREARNALESARDKIAEIVGLNSRHSLVFTSGATEAASMVLHSRFFECAAIEHDCVTVWANPHLSVSKFGHVTVDSPGESSLQMANSETGIIQDIPEGILFTDAVQAFGKVRTDFSDISYEFAAISSHKIGGPKGVGALLVNDGATIAPLIRGGGQETGNRSGTECLTNIIGFAAAAEHRSTEIKSGLESEIRKRRDYLERLLREVSDSTIIIGKSVKRLPNTSYFLTPGWQGDLQVAGLDLRGFSVSSGMACSNGKKDKGRAVVSMGYSKELSDCGIRVSIGSTTTTEDLERFVEAWSLQLNEWKKKAA